MSSATGFKLFFIGTATAFLLTACITVKKDVELSSENEPVEFGWDLTVAPYYFHDRVALFKKYLLQSSDQIEVVDTVTLWRTVFPDRDPDADAMVSEFQQKEIASRVSAMGIRHMIVLAMDINTEYGTPIATILYNTVSATTTCRAVLLTFFDNTCTLERYQSVAEGRDHIAWYFIGVHFDADTSEGALKAITDRMAGYIEALNPDQPVKVVIVAGR